MPAATVSLPVLAAKSSLRLTPTDVTQFVRLEQCERFLRFRLAERAGQDFMEEYGVVQQRITPLLSLSGHNFEEGVEDHLAKKFSTINYATRYRMPGRGSRQRECPASEGHDGAVPVHPRDTARPVTGGLGAHA